LGVIEYLDVAGIQKAGHALRITRTWQCTRDNDTVVARQHTEQLRLITFSRSFMTNVSSKDGLRGF